MQRDVVGSRVATRALILFSLAALASPAWSLEYPGPSPGPAEMDFDGRRLTAEERKTGRPNRARSSLARRSKLSRSPFCCKGEAIRIRPSPWRKVRRN